MRKSSRFVLRFSTLAVCILLLLFLRSETLLADRIVLKDGNVVEGKIIRTTRRDVTLKGRFGMISFPLKQIKTIHQQGRIWSPEDPPPAPEVKSSTDSDFDPGLNWQMRSLKERLLRYMGEIEANPLDYWKEYWMEPAPSRVSQAYRLLKAKTEYEYSDRLPDGPGEYVRVWAHKRNTFAGPPGGVAAPSEGL